MVFRAVQTAAAVMIAGMFVTESAAAADSLAMSGVPGNGGSLMKTGRLSGASYTITSPSLSSVCNFDL